MHKLSLSLFHYPLIIPSPVANNIKNGRRISTMCTAISDTTNSHLFGRTLDLEFSYGESITIAPRKFKFQFLHEGSFEEHSAIIGTAHVRDGYPLFYDAANEYGLAVAALSFPEYTVYHPYKKDTVNLASFEVIPFILSRCKSLADVKKLLSKINVTQESFNPNLPASTLHWLIASKDGSLVFESTASGINVYDNPFGVLTNAPPFSYHIENIRNYLSLSPSQPQNRICPEAELTPYSRGMGAFGLPGDVSSASRFVRAVFSKAHTESTLESNAEITRFFHIMDTISQPLGFARTDEGKPIYTVYTSCIDTENLNYYFTTYNCRRIRCVAMKDLPLSSSALVSFQTDVCEDIKHLDLTY